MQVARRDGTITVPEIRRMHIDIVRDETAFADLGTEWNELLPGSVSDVPFLRHDFLTAWWSTRGGGEWPGGELCLGVGRDESGGLSGIAPIFRTTSSDGSPTLRLLGSREVADYLDVIVHRDRLEDFLEALLTRLEREAWDQLEFDNILESSPTLPIVEAGARRRGWWTQRAQGKPCPVVSLAGGWEGYLSRLHRKQRHELRRKMRRALVHPEPVEFRLVQEAGAVEAEMEAFLHLMGLDPAKARFLTPAMRSFFHRLAVAGAEGRWLRLGVMLVAGRRAAGYLNFVYRNRLWIYNSGLDPTFLSLSPGWVLLGHLIETAAQEGIQAADFLRGEEAYKTQLGGVPRFVEHLTVGR
jgi:CelD/BcsL family acetyltransferase involved in cellulose biosynthesis